MFTHKVQYYETDKMGITHHSNYIRWMEEARVEYLAELGFDYDKLEAAGIVSPVLAVTCDYKKPTRFPQSIAVKTSVAAFSGVRLTIAYEMTDEAGDTVATGTTSHCFLNESGRPVRMKKDFPALYDALFGELKKTESV